MATPSSLQHSKDVSWYLPGPPKLTDDVKDLLYKWSEIEPSQAEKHVERIREEAWKVHQYPCRKPTHGSLCIGGYRFLSLSLKEHPSFEKVVNSLKFPEGLFLDLGCCVGQDLRSLAYAGVPGACLVGIELESAFIDIGYDLFLDREKLGAKFIDADITTLDTNKPHPLSSLIGRVSNLWASAFFHLWGLEGQKTLCQKVLMLLQDKPGVRTLGRHVGSQTAGEKVHITSKSGLMYRHNPESFRKMWAEALGHRGEVEEHGTLQSPSHGTWVVKAWFEEEKNSSSEGKDWLNRVAKESEGEAKNAADRSTAADEKALMLFWELERTG